MSSRLGVITDRYAQPLFQILREDEKEKFSLLENNPAELAIMLRQKELDGAFLSPIDYAKDYAMYRIIPGIAAVSRMNSGLVTLFFTESAHTITRIGVNPAYQSDIVLASIILNEKFEIHPQIIPTISGISNLGKQVDAYLVSGDTASDLREHKNKIDLVDEWCDITELPYVHGFWVTREGSLPNEVIDTIILSGKKGSSLNEKSNDVKEESEFSRFYYTLGDNEIQAVGEFFRMAYYHGIIKDIPDVKFV